MIVKLINDFSQIRDSGSVLKCFKNRTTVSDLDKIFYWLQNHDMKLDTQHFDRRHSILGAL